jgi:ribosomal protein S18 acetylase RimI-like enzyme
MQQFAIRPMTADDIALIVDWMVSIPLWQRYHVSTTSARAGFEKGLQQGDLLLVGDWEVEHKAVAFAWCLQTGAFGRSAYLRLIGVNPHFARHGLGTALLAHTERLALAYSKDMFLLVSDFNAEAQRFYQRHGYTQVGAIAGYVLPDVTELIFRKSLQNAL